ncbi:MAG TPA: S46 family peptidase [Williamwhitmania sp.]|nr:S46 family peptidase [Williamwhitmania sp.]
MRRFIVILAAVFIASGAAIADEGMWLPLLVGKQKLKEMRAEGFKLTAEDLYSVNHASLKDAIVQFGGGCTGELISGEGLLITNHHCGYGSIQAHSTLDHNYLENGFWAMSRAEELPNPGLSVRFLVSMEDVTSTVLLGITDTVSEINREKLISQRITALKAAATKGNSYIVEVDPLFNGNQYFLYTYEEFTDIRLVGAPPSSIGKFGGDTDNWMWPRHTGDFSLFRIYAGKDNKPAPYSPSNVPYKPKKFLEISIKGIKAGDFTLVYGYPGRTQEYFPSFAVRLLVDQSDPSKIALRQARLQILGEAMASNPKVRIMYAAKYASVANGWKKWIGEVKGLSQCNGIQVKEEQEEKFSAWVNGNTARTAQYGMLLPQLKQDYQEYAPFSLARDYYREAIGSIEIFRVAAQFERFAQKLQKKSEFSSTDSLKLKEFNVYLHTFYKNYDPAIDRRVLSSMLSAYLQNVPAQFVPQDMLAAFREVRNWPDTIAAVVFHRSMFADSLKAFALLQQLDSASIRDVSLDPAVKINHDIMEMYSQSVAPSLTQMEEDINIQLRRYMRATMEMNPRRTFYPDANFTLRIAFGQVQGYQPRDAVQYEFHSTLTGVMEKEDSTIYDYVVAPKLKKLYEMKDFGRYGEKGNLPVAFIATNHTTGGNSGSPVLNGKGQLIGVNFDRVWEGTMSDIMFDNSRCRNISLDVRYALFIIDKYAGAGWLLNEMKIVD